ncbi:hypothetical protein EYS14_04885 [Alteromonadaceae bacterium M269]|nr:hypothetical protein EYS14_04885 [Alteromonadaceae bacterium M269]
MKSRLSCVLLISLAIQACGGGNRSTPPAAPPEPSTPVVTNPEAPPTSVISNYIGFESAPVRPIVQQGNWLYVTNTPNNTVEAFELDETGSAQARFSIPVGLEPISLAMESLDKLWVVNHLSDSVSVIDLGLSIPVVTRTLLVGDEPQDIVFAKGKAFISTAHRGQHLDHPSLIGVPGAGDPQLHTPSIGRADVWVFDPANLGNAIGGIPQKIISLFGDSPRSLAVSNDESHVYVAVYHSGNQTTAVHEAVICQGFEDDELGENPCRVMDGITSPNGIENGWLPGGRTAPGQNAEGEFQPWTSMIVQYEPQSGQWQDSQGRNFSNGIRFNLPDNDVFAIDTSTLNEDGAYQHVGTTLFNLAVHPVTDTLFSTNTEANNAVRFEGSGEHGGSTVQGNIARSQISLIAPDTGNVRIRPINRHIDYSQLKASPSVKEHSLSTPTQMQFSNDGSELFVATIGSNKVARFNVSELTDDALWDDEDQEFSPTQASQSHINVEGGPVGIHLNSDNNKLYVFTRFDNVLVTFDTETGLELQRISMATPEPE